MNPVLVVGEDADFRRFVRITLQRAGHAVVEVRSVAEAAEAASRAKPAAIVYDCPLGERGSELQQRLGEEDGAAVPVLWVTSGLLGERPAGPWVLVKPFDPGELVGLLENMLQKPAA